MSQKSRTQATVAALHYGRPTPPGHRPNQYSQRNISAFGKPSSSLPLAARLNETGEDNMQKVRESVYNRKRGQYSEVPVSHGGRHTPTVPKMPGSSRDPSPVPPYPQQTTFANFSKNAHTIQQPAHLRSSEDMSRSGMPRRQQAHLKRGLSGGGADNRGRTYVHMSSLQTPGHELAHTQPLNRQGARNHQLSSTQLLESVGGSGVMVHPGDERTKSYDRTLSPGMAMRSGGGETLKNSHKSFTGSSKKSFNLFSRVGAHHLCL